MEFLDIHARDLSIWSLIVAFRGKGCDFVFLYRFVGFVGFMRTNKRVYFIFFPNLFDMAFLWMLLFSPATPWVWLALLFFAKEVHEFILHYWWPHAHPTEG